MLHTFSVLGLATVLLLAGCREAPPRPLAPPLDPTTASEAKPALAPAAERPASEEPSPSATLAEAPRVDRGRKTTPSIPRAPLAVIGGTSIAMGRGAHCGLEKDGTPWCWHVRNPSAKPSKSLRLRRMAIGSRGGCGIGMDYRLVCWGNFRHMDLWKMPRDVAFKDVAYVDEGICAVTRAEGRVECWTPRTGRDPMGGEVGFDRIDRGHSIICAGRADGTGKCVGRWIHRAPGDLVSVDNGLSATACGQRSDGTVWCASRKLTLPTARYLDIAVGSNRVCGLREDQTAICAYGFLTSGEQPKGEFVQLAAADSNVCGLRSDGEVSCWGDDYSARTALPEGRYVDIAVGNKHACVLARNGAVECWGSDTDGESSPPEGAFKAIAVGERTSCGLRSSGSLECWGYVKPRRRWGPSQTEGPFDTLAMTSTSVCARKQSGEMTCLSAARGRKMWPLEHPVETHAAGSVHCGLTDEGRVRCSGYASARQLEEDAPDEPLHGLTVGWSHGCALRADDTVACFGPAYGGGDRAPPGKFKFLSAANGTCGLDVEGRVTCWGATNMPSAAVRAARFTKIGVAHTRSCGLKTDQTVLCWPAPGEPAAQ